MGQTVEPEAKDGSQSPGADAEARCATDGRREPLKKKHRAIDAVTPPPTCRRRRQIVRVKRTVTPYGGADGREVYASPLTLSGVCLEVVADGLHWRFYNRKLCIATMSILSRYTF